jgi:hypothetical protein
MNYYPALNEVTCCGRSICTECLAAVVPPPPKERICPFDRTNKTFTVRANVDWKNLVHAETGVMQEPHAMDSDRPDEFNALLWQFPHLNEATAWELYQAGIPVEDIAAEAELGAHTG